VDANDYYPFGMNHLKTGNAFFAQGSYKAYKFVGNELQETGFYDMNARFYMADLGRFGQYDPLSASTLDPYGYGYNNLILFADPSGLEGEPVNGETGPGGPQSIGTPTNPIDVGEVIVNAPIRAMASNSASILPNNCSLCYSGNGSSSGINLPAPSATPISPSFYKPVLHNGSAQMMDGLLWDVAAIYLANNVKPENKYAAAGVGLLAILLSRGHAADEVLKAEASIAKAELAVEKSVLNADVNVVRGGTCLACQFENGSGVTINSNGLLNGVSVNSVERLSVKELSAGIPNGKIGTTTVSQIEALGGKVSASPTKNNPFHATLSGITPQQAEKLFNPTIKNPLK